MQYRFNAEEWRGLATAERVRRCRLWAEEAQKLAQGAPPKMAANYLSIAADWLKLASEMEENSK